MSVVHFGMDGAHAPAHAPPDVLSIEAAKQLFKTLEESGQLTFSIYAKKKAHIKYLARGIKDAFDVDTMPPMTYALATGSFEYDTMLPNGVRECVAEAKPGNYIIKGAAGEAYTVAKSHDELMKIYTLVEGSSTTIRAIQSERYLARYNGENIVFKTKYAPVGTICNTGDYLQTDATRTKYSCVNGDIFNSETGFELYDEKS